MKLKTIILGSLLLISSGFAVFATVPAHAGMGGMSSAIVI